MNRVKPNGCNKNYRLAVVLAGGLSKRFGSDKVHAKICGKPFLEILVEALTGSDFQVCFGVAKLKRFPELNHPILEDLFPHEGPLQALYSSLSQLVCTRVLLVACDMPLIEPSVIKELWEKSEKADITCLEFQGKLFPLPGVYSKNVVPRAKDLLNQGRRDLKALLKSGLDIKTISVPSEKSVFNINTLESLREAAHLVL